MEAPEAMVVARAYGAHQQARRRMKQIAQDVSRFDNGQKAIDGSEVVQVVEEYLRTGEALDAAIDTKGLLPLG